MVIKQFWTPALSSRVCINKELLDLKILLCFEVCVAKLSALALSVGCREIFKYIFCL